MKSTENFHRSADLKHRKASGYGVWATMLQRCNNPNNTNYHKYGGRGIKVCEEWLSFDKFIGDMGTRPSLEYTIDRIDNNKGYNVSNCRWATKITQSINRRIQSNNKSHFIGISWDKARNKWTSHIQVKGKQYNLGRFDTIGDALLARKNAETTYHSPYLLLPS